MRLIQKNLKHKGYAVFTGQNTILVPLFTDDYLLEANTFLDSYEKEGELSLSAIYVSDTTASMVRIKEFKERYNTIPRNYVEEIRTGFQNGAGLTQTLPRFVYK